MSDYTQIVYFAPKDGYVTGTPEKKIKGTEMDAELAAIATAILSKLDSADLASNAEAAALASTSKLLTPAGLLYAMANGNFTTAPGLITGLTAATPVAGDSLMLYDLSGTALTKCLVSDLLALVPAAPAADGQTVVLTKTASESVTGSITLQADDHLVTGSLAAGTYLFELQGGGSFNGANGGIRMAFGGGATIRATNPDDSRALGLILTIDGSSTFQSHNGSGYPTVGTSVAVTGSPTNYSFKAWAKLVLTAPGTVQFQWAQQTATGSTTLSGGTYMTYRKVA